MATNERRYTKINRDQVLADLQAITKAKIGPLADIGKSAYGQLLMELFAAHTDTDATWIESSFRDSFLETATSSEAINVGARSLGYSVRRPVPAKAGFGVALKRTGVYSTVKVNIAKGAVFSVAGKTLTVIDDIELLYDRNDPNFENGIMTVTSGRPVLAEGTVQQLQFFSDGSKNQEFLIADRRFSDWFGYGDPNYVEPDEMDERINRFTVVSSDASLIDNPVTVEGYEDKIYWRISRRGLHDPAISPSAINDIDNFVSTSSTNLTTNYTVSIVTANDGRSMLEFGDGIVSAIPYGLIDLTYFSTTGAEGNTSNVAGLELDVQGTKILITQEDGSDSDITLSDLSIALTTDVRNGLNIESTESIRKNAPKIYNSLDSLHNRNSYVLFLNRISNIKYANAFGESSLKRVKPNGNFDMRYANIVRFTLLKDLYKKTGENYFISTPFEYYPEGYKVNGLTYIWDYDYTVLSDENHVFDITPIKDRLDNSTLSITNTATNPPTVLSVNEFIRDYIKPDLAEVLIPQTVFTTNLEPKDFIVPGSELDTILDQLNRRGYLTLGGGQHQYIHPIVHDMTMAIDVVLFEGGVYSDIKTKIINNIYAYLKEYTEFAKPIFRSKIECLVQKMPEVAGLNLYFKSKTNKYTDLDLNNLEWMGTSTSQYINQSTLSIEDFDITLEYDYNSNTDVLNEDNTQTFTIGNQPFIRDAIKNYYNSYIARVDINDISKIRHDLTEEDINKFTSYVWSTAMNEVYTSIFNEYSDQKSNGEYSKAQETFAILESIRGWYFESGVLAFKDTDNIINMDESGNDNKLAFYKTYILEYVKLIRNILAVPVSIRLIDEDGNVSKYSNQNEIVQFNVNASDITVTVGTV